MLKVFFVAIFYLKYIFDDCCHGNKLTRGKMSPSNNMMLYFNDVDMQSGIDFGP